MIKKALFLAFFCFGVLGYGEAVDRPNPGIYGILSAPASAPAPPASCSGLTFDAVSEFLHSGFDQTWSHTHTIGDVNNLVVVVNWGTRRNSGQVLDWVKVNGVFASTVSNSNPTGVSYGQSYSVDQTTGSVNVTVQFSAGVRGGVSIVSYGCGITTGPVRTSGTTSGTGTSASVTTTTFVNDVMLNSLIVRADDETITEGTGETELSETDCGSCDGMTHQSSRDEAEGSTETIDPSWTTSANYGMSALVLKPKYD